VASIASRWCPEMARWLLPLVFGACFFVAPVAQAGAALPVQPCGSSAACGGCSVCVSGSCQPSTLPLCRCDAECELYGYGSCELSHADRPSCGGACTKSKATSGLACGEGSNAWMLGPVPTPSKSVPTSAVVSPDQLEVVISSWSPVRKEDSPSGCSLGRGASGGLVIGPLLLGLGLLRRRR
jgi:hypothetical protein